MLGGVGRRGTLSVWHTFKISLLQCRACMCLSVLRECPLLISHRARVVRHTVDAGKREKRERLCVHDVSGVANLSNYIIFELNKLGLQFTSH